MDSKMIAILYLISLGVFFVFLVVATIAVIAGTIKKKKKVNKTRNQEDSEDEYEESYQYEDNSVAYQGNADANAQDDIFEEAVMEANQIANETATQMVSSQPDVSVQQIAQPAQKMEQSKVQVTPVPVVEYEQPEAPAQQMAPSQPEVPVQQMVQPEVQVQQMVQPVEALQPQETNVSEIPEVPATTDSAFVEDSAFTDSAFAEDSAFVDSAFADSAFTDSAFANNADGNAFPGSAFENPTLVDPSAMTAATVNFSQGGMGQDPVGNFYWFNKEDVEDRPEYKPVEMFYRYFKTASECIEDLLIEMYDCALVRTEEIRFIAYGIEPRHVAMRDVAATGSAAYNAAKKRKEPSKEDLDKIYRKWCSYVDKLFEIVEFRADNTTIGIIRDKLYEFGKSDVDILIQGK